MGRAGVLREIRRMRLEALLERHERDGLSQVEAAEMLGVSGRTFRRWRDRRRDETSTPPGRRRRGRQGRRAAAHDRRRDVRRRQHHRRPGDRLGGAFATSARLVLGQEAVPNKANVLTAIPVLPAWLARQDGLRGALASIDAIATNGKIAQAIRDAGTGCWT